MEPTFFATPGEFRAWLHANHGKTGELWVGFHKVGSGKPSITWPQSVDEALCVGWIDGVRKRLDDDSYVIRFTPRKPDSTWSAVNIRRMGELLAEGRVLPAGKAAFERRRDDRSAIYSYEQRKTAELPDEYQQRFRANAAAWEFFQSQPPWYRRTSTYWVVSAKKEETREKRLATLIDDSAHRRTIAGLTRPGKNG
ncbi:MAG TPA: YdeI/OmpD-associated family protein [Longimicrobium sp.]|nr:YdeI/OmpD-associated family protein [Longimicrobium sp.]